MSEERKKLQGLNPRTAQQLEAGEKQRHQQRRENGQLGGHEKAMGSWKARLKYCRRRERCTVSNPAKGSSVMRTKK